MIKTLKKIICALMVLVLLLTMAGCHGSAGRTEFSVPEQFDETKEYEITFWAKNDTNKNQTRIYEDAIKSFEAIYPNIKVNLKLYTDYGKIYNDVITNIATSTTPNVCITYPDHIATYLNGNNVVAPLDELMEDAKYGFAGSEVRFDAPAKDEVVPEYLIECIIDGRQYAVPYMRSTEALYINKTFVEALGYEIPDIVTWDFVWEVSEAAMAKDDGDENVYSINGQSVLIPFIYKSTDNMMIQMLRQQGADYSDDGGSIKIFNDTTKDILYTITEHAKTGAFSTFKISSYPANFLNAGQCIFAVDSTAGSTWMGSNAPLLDISADQIVEFETVVRPVPQFDTENPVMISQGPSICIFNKQDPQEVLASWLFVQYMLSNDVQIPYAETEGYVPVTVKAQQSSEYADYLSRSGEDNNVHYDIKIAATQLLLDNIENTFTTPVFSGSASLRDAAGQMIENVTKSVRRKQTVNDEYIENLYSDMNSLYRLDQLGGVKNGEKADLGPLPGTSVALLCSLVTVWILLGGWTVYKKAKEKK